MKSIIKFAVSNPVTICMLVLAILLLGKISYDQLAVDLLPDLFFNDTATTEIYTLSLHDALPI